MTKEVNANELLVQLVRRASDGRRAIDIPSDIETALNQVSAFPLNRGETSTEVPSRRFERVP